MTGNELTRILRRVLDPDFCTEPEIRDVLDRVPETLWNAFDSTVEAALARQDNPLERMDPLVRNDRRTIALKRALLVEERQRRRG